MMNPRWCSTCPSPTSPILRMPCARLLCSWFALMLLASCSCTGAGDGTEGTDVAGELWGTRRNDLLSLELASVDAPIRTFQVDVELRGARALEVAPRMERPWRIIEAGLAEGARERFTLVLADERRLLLSDGPLVDIRIESEGAGDWEVTLSRARGVTDEGKAIDLSAGVR